MFLEATPSDTRAETIKILKILPGLSLPLYRRVESRSSTLLSLLRELFQEYFYRSERPTPGIKNYFIYDMQRL